METYFRRVLKYFIQLVVLFVILFTFMFLTGTAADNGDRTLSQILISQRGLLLAVVVVVLSLLYPRFGFVTREIKSSVADTNEQIMKAFAVSGYELSKSESAETMVFRADNIAKRILTLWEDKITVTEKDGCVTISGIRKEVVKVEFRLKSFLQNDEDK